MAEPLITIKKPDGTFAKVTLSEFKKIQAEHKQKESQKGTVSAANPSVNQVMTKSTIEIKNTADTKKDTVPQHKKLTRDDARSPLEEKIRVKSQAPLTSPKRESQVEEVLRKIGFGVGPDLQGRLKSLILARLKDIKTEDEIKETLSRPIKNGGLGLVEAQIEKVIKSCREVLAVVSSETKDVQPVPVLKGKPSDMALMVEPPELPMVIPVHNSFASKNTTPSAPVAKPGSDHIISKLINESMASEPVFKISNKPAIRPSMQDISAPDTEMGPVEEFKSITIEEFRRLSSNPEEAAKRLLQKMTNLKDESFVWYLDGIAAYHNSPLYVEYMTAVSQSLTERKSLASVLSAKNGIKLTEVMALIEMEQDL
jgi:hypothetical protein